MNLTKSYTDNNFDFWISQDFISDETRAQVSGSDILLIPTLNFRGQTKPVFPVNTEKLFSYLKQNLSADQKVEILINDSEYFELALHGKSHRLGKWIVHSVVLPISLGILTNYLYDEIKGAHPNAIDKQEVIAASKDKVTFTIIVQKEDGKCIEFTYDGDVKNIDEVTKSIEKMWKE